MSIPTKLSNKTSKTFKLKADIDNTVQQNKNHLITISHKIHAHPELGFEEKLAAKLVSEYLAETGFTVKKPAYGLETAIEATFGSGDMVVAICAEYDCLPEIGHACGHNIIAATALGAATALAQVAKELGITVKVLGTPGEEGGGGKIIMLQRGAFEDVSVAMMVHPWPVDTLQLNCLAVEHFEVHYMGRQAHASAFPWQGINAADAFVVAQVALGLLRQHLEPGHQIHGVVLKGGEAANVIPEHAFGRFMIRTPDIKELEDLRQKVRNCFKAGALATKCKLKIKSLGPIYSQFVADSEILEIYKLNSQKLGRSFTNADSLNSPDNTQKCVTSPTISTDMANVSLVVPAIHPMIGINSLPSRNHEPGFAAAAVSPHADRAVIDGATALAWTAVDLATTPKIRKRLTRHVG
ncbi:MAG: M20 family metallopeptidase [Actinobacteria bacterium]|nr:M20 family metallopeptidase [Actinomycetota bacterium]MCL6105137.1 M20 family metallopeptidase [Actinomycetota bacterium]